MTQENNLQIDSNCGADGVYYDVLIQELNVPNSNGRIYTTENVEKWLKQNNNKPIFGQIGMPEISFKNDSPVITNLFLENTSHAISNLRIVDDCLIGDVCCLKTTEGDHLRNLISHLQGEFAISAYTCERRDGVVTMLEIHSINFVNKRA